MTAEITTIHLPIDELYRKVLKELLFQPTIRPPIRDEFTNALPADLQRAVGNLAYIRLLCSDDLVDFTGRMGLDIPIILKVPLVKRLFFTIWSADIKIPAGHKEAVMSIVYWDGFDSYQLYPDELVNPLFINHAWVTGSHMRVVRVFSMLTPDSIRNSFICEISQFGENLKIKSLFPQVF